MGFRPRRAKLVDRGHIRGKVVLIERLGDTGYVHIGIEGQATPIIVTVRQFDVLEGESTSIELDLKCSLFF